MAEVDALFWLGGLGVQLIGCLWLQVWRYYLLSNRPEAQDSDFKWVDLQVRPSSTTLTLAAVRFH